MRYYCKCVELRLFVFCLHQEPRAERQTLRAKRQVFLIILFALASRLFNLYSVFQKPNDNIVAGTGTPCPLEPVPVYFLSLTAIINKLEDDNKQQSCAQRSRLILLLLLFLPSDCLIKASSNDFVAGLLKEIIKN